MKIALLIEIELRHVSGKFASRETLVELLLAEFENSDPGSISTDDGEYEIDGFSVDELLAKELKL